MEEHAGLHIALSAERLGTFLGLPITNTLLSAWLVMSVLIIIAIVVGRKPTLIPGKVQNFFELIFEFVIGYMSDIFGNRKRALTFFPFIATIFLFIATSNLFDFMPFVGSITFTHEGETMSLFRPVNTDLNVTLALAIISVITIEVAGIVALGFWKYMNKFFTFSGKTIGQRFLNLTVGLIEFVSEMSRFISFSFRLFGNIFAGEVLLAVVAYFMPYLLPVPLMGFETFVGVVQAAVFAMLTLFFLKLAMTPAHGSGEAHH
ncbi:ATP synthase F0 subunit A [Candidatus Adlerbacteria bacterium RIFOXYC1_FULL_48_26]|uniref:ATP synthase subunit a n=1 Tax=Candidatus Adlerbacteria bacterium RIFOXYC1_FULL_48_26 TaxID=1797247 RepID=A0A1F4Y3I4_9BACT|nr:MAG: ATP synthase F0 subunit A [Candidatus Adlerbacteria bacterium RIFOXYC1_FULL_48_26]OGC93829.1 MAG: ATP synthase F0 subunit A [Candidatus Adlerbacteria bacterium RIFOXYB1_FULL_48_10]OGC96417.1 MAG: ATP synthase F0 subunit A [Candidatus Adlerbacteria bacterium RIFOXYD1_FULL_48_8]